MQKAVKNKDLKRINQILERRPELKRDVLSMICHYGYTDLAKLFMDNNNAMLHNAICEAAYMGHNDLVKLLLTTKSGIYDWALAGACEGSHRNLVDYLLELIIDQGLEPDYDFGLYGSCASASCASKDLIDLMIQRGATDWGWGLSGACKNYNKKIIDLMIAKGSDDWNLGLSSSFRNNCIQSAELMLSRGASNVDHAFKIACYEGHLEIIEYFERFVPLSIDICHYSLCPHIFEFLRFKFPGRFESDEALIQDLYDHLLKFKYLKNVLGPDVCKEIKYFL